MALGFYRNHSDANAAEPIILPDGTGVPPAIDKPVVAFLTSCTLWKREFPNLRVGRKGEDTCTICFGINRNPALGPYMSPILSQFIILR